MPSQTHKRPLPQVLSDAAPKKFGKGMHAGLWFDRFFDKYEKHDKDWQVPKDDSGKLAWIQTVAGEVGGDAVSTLADRQKKLVIALEGDSLVAKTDWHFVTGLGNNHPVENGFAWHPTLGVPYLTAAAVKGLLRAWCEEWLGWKISEEEKKRLLQWFGDETRAGELIFFDALPTGPVTLKADVMTPHYGEWYEKGAQKPESDGSNVPADWHNPKPIPFLVVIPDQTFQFSVALRPCATTNVGDVLIELEQALQYLGVGAKTAAGYGRMSNHIVEKPDPLNEFKIWFGTQKFGSGNKGRHAEIIERINQLSNPQDGKIFVKTNMGKKDCTKGLWAFLSKK